MDSTINYISPSQFSSIIQAIPDLKLRRFDFESVQFLFKITYNCALRINEGIRLRKSDFDLSRKEVWLGDTKTRQADKASIPESFIPELEMFLRALPKSLEERDNGIIKIVDDKDQKLFPGMNRQIVHIWTKRLGKMLNIKAWNTPQTISHEKTKTHAFRKSYAKDLLYGTYNNGKPAPLSIIQKKLRHADLKTTSNYLSVNLDEVKAWEKSD